MSCLGGFGVGETHSSSCGPLQRSVNGARITHEVGAGPGIGGEEFVGKEIAFQLVAANAGEDDVPGMVHPALGKRIHVVERRRVKIEGAGAIDAAAAAVAHGGALDGALVSGPAKVADAGASRAPREAGESGEHDAVVLSTNGHFTSREKATPRGGRNSQRGASDQLVVVSPATNG